MDKIVLLTSLLEMVIINNVTMQTIVQLTSFLELVIINNVTIHKHNSC